MKEIKIYPENGTLKNIDNSLLDLTKPILTRTLLFGSVFLYKHQYKYFKCDR